VPQARTRTQALVDVARAVGYAFGVTDRYFSLDEANALVPRVAGLMTRAIQLHSHLRLACQTLMRAGIRVTPEMLGGRVLDVDLDPVQRQRVAQARGLYEAVKDTVDEVESLGAEVKDVEKGLVDFHSLLDGSTRVMLCWKIGEQSIDWYHEIESGFSGRKPVAGLLFSNRGS
jgi:hypothetical protein